MQREGFGLVGVGFCSSPHHQDPLKRLQSRLIRHGSELFPPIGYDGQADVGAAAGGSDDSSTSLSHCGTVSQHQQLSHTHPAEAGAHRLTTHTHHSLE